MMLFWKELLKCMMDMKYISNGDDTCMYFRLTTAGLFILLSWMDDCMVWVQEKIVNEWSKSFNDRFYWYEVGDVRKYGGCKIVRYY